MWTLQLDTAFSNDFTIATFDNSLLIYTHRDHHFLLNASSHCELTFIWLSTMTLICSQWLPHPMPSIVYVNCSRATLTSILGSVLVITGILNESTQNPDQNFSNLVVPRVPLWKLLSPHLKSSLLQGTSTLPFCGITDGITQGLVSNAHFIWSWQGNYWVTELGIAGRDYQPVMQSFSFCAHTVFLFLFSSETVIYERRHLMLLNVIHKSYRINAYSQDNLFIWPLPFIFPQLFWGFKI